MSMTVLTRSKPSQPMTNRYLLPISYFQFPKTLIPISLPTLQPASKSMRQHFNINTNTTILFIQIQTKLILLPLSTPQQTNYLHDTAQLLNGVPRHPTNTKFVPVGHISLDSQNPGVETIGVTSSAPGMFWIKTFFVSRTVQSKGVGRAAMDEVEAMAGRAPLSAKTLVLDVIVGEDQMREDFALATSGFIPKVCRLFIGFVPG